MVIPGLLNEYSFELFALWLLSLCQEVLPGVVNAVSTQESGVALGEEAGGVLGILAWWLAGILSRVTAHVVACRIEARTSNKWCIFGLTFGEVELSGKSCRLGQLLIASSFRTSR